MRTYFAYSLLILVTVMVSAAVRARVKYLTPNQQAWVSKLLGAGLGILAVGMLLLLGCFTEPQARDLFVDFTKAYYPAGQAAVHHPASLYARLDNDLTFVNLPIVSLLFAPFAAFDLKTASILMTGLGILATIGACIACSRFSGVAGWRQLALLGLFTASGPLFYNLRMGNTSQYTLLLLVGVLVCLRRQRQWLAGGLLAIAAVIKVPLLLLGGYYLLRGRWRVVAGFAVGLLSIVLLSLLVFGPEQHLIWYQTCIQPFAGKPLSAFNVQSVDGLLARSLLGGGLRNWTPMTVDWHYKLIRYGLVAALVGSAIWVCWRARPPASEQAENSEFAIALCLALIISPISWTHYYLMLLLPLSLGLGNRLAVPGESGWLSWLALSTLLISLPTVNPNPSDPLLRLLMSHYFLGATLLLIVLLIARWQTARAPQLSGQDTKLFA